MKAGSRKRVALICGGLALSATFLWLALRQVDAASLGTAFSAVSVGRLPLCLTAIAVGIVLRAVRWRVLSGASPARQPAYLRATSLGALVNLLLPGRAGDVVRVITLAKLVNSPLPGPIASALVDRLVDVLVLLASACVVYLMFPATAMLGKWLAILAPAFLVASFVVVRARGRILGESFLTRLAARWLRRSPVQSAVFVGSLRGEFRSVLANCLQTGLVLLAVLILCADYAAMAALLFAFDLSIPFQAPLLLWVFLAAGSALPSAPGYVGVYQVAAVWALALFAVPAASAVAVATVLQICTLAVAFIMASPSVVAGIRRAMSTQPQADHRNPAASFRTPE